MSEKNEAEQKCCCKGCELRGVPSEGFDFYVCDGCLEELDRCLQAEGAKVYGRHSNN